LKRIFIYISSIFSPIEQGTNVTNDISDSGRSRIFDMHQMSYMVLICFGLYSMDLSSSNPC
jgi:hypothetical protein